MEHPRAVLAGSWHPAPLWLRGIAFAFVIACLSPWIAIGLGLVVGGLLPFLDPDRLGDLRIALPAGIALLSIFGSLLWYVFWIRGRRAVTWFEWDGKTLTYNSAHAGKRSRAAGEIRSVEPVRARRGLSGWRVTFDDGQWVWLRAGTTDADRLVERLKPISWSNPFALS